MELEDLPTRLNVDIPPRLNRLLNTAIPSGFKAKIVRRVLEVLVEACKKDPYIIVDLLDDEKIKDIHLTGPPRIPVV